MLTMLWFIVCGLLALFIYFKVVRPLSFWEKQGIPYLKPWPFIGNISLGRTSFFDLIHNYYKAMDHKYFGIWNFTQPILVVKDTEMIKQICVRDFEHFIDHKSFFNETDEPVFSENLFNAKGERWRQIRSILSPVFTGSKMRQMYTLIAECAQRITDHLKETGSNKPLELEMKDFYRRCTIDVIATCAYGVESNSFKENNNEFYQKSHEVSDFSGIKSLKLIGYMIFPSLMRALKLYFFTEKQIDFFRQIVKNTIAFREKNGIVRPDLLHIMMEARKGQLKFEDPEKYSNAGFATIEESEVGKNSNVKLDVTDDLIIAQAMVFFIGGTDTTSSLLSLASHELALNPDIQRKLQDEIDRVHKECSGKVTYEVITKMKYLDMVISESLRKWPQGFMVERYCNKDLEVKTGEKSLVIKQGQSVWIPVVGLHRDPKFYPDPEKFDPERFSDENKKNINSSAFLPFGQGPRSCIGNRFALLITKTFLYYVALNFNFVVTKKTDIPLKLSKTQLILNSANGFWLELQKRS